MRQQKAVRGALLHNSLLCISCFGERQFWRVFLLCAAVQLFCDWTLCCACGKVQLQKCCTWAGAKTVTKLGFSCVGGCNAF